MEFPKKGSARGSRRGHSTETDNPEICGLCGNRVPSTCLSDEMLIGGNLPDNTCHCFLSNPSEIDSTEDGSTKSGRKTESPSVIPRSSDSSEFFIPVKQNKSRVKDESCSVSLKSSEGKSAKSSSKTPGFSSSSNGYATSLELSDRYFTDNTNNTTTSSGEDTEKEETDVKNVERNENKRNSEIKTGSEEEYKGSLPSMPSPTKRRLLNNQEIRGGESSTSQYRTHIETNSNRENQRSVLNNREITGGEQSTSQYWTLTRASSNRENQRSVLNNQEVTGGEPSTSQYRTHIRTSSNRENQRSILNNQELRGGESSTSRYRTHIRTNSNRENRRSMEVDNYRYQNLNLGFQSARPPLPRPFSNQNQPFINPAYQPFPTTCRPHYHPVVNAVSIVRGANVVVRFHAVPSPRQIIPGYQQTNQAAAIPVNAQQLKIHTERNPRRTFDRIEEWIVNVEKIRGERPSEEPSSDVDSSLNQNENIFPEQSTDERSSTEISEEENERQRSLRCPPRFSKKDKPK